MKVIYDGHELTLDYNENGHVFALYDDEGEMVDRLDPAGYYGKAEPNTAWVSELYVDLLINNKVVELTGTQEEGADGMVGYLVDIIHPEFNDHGYSPFGDFCRNRLGQQCQYGSRYITGRLEGYPALGEGLRFLNEDSGNYHSIRIHRDDMDEFERRYRAYNAESLNG